MEWYVILRTGKVSIIAVQVNYGAVSHTKRVYCIFGK